MRKINFILLALTLNSFPGIFAAQLSTADTLAFITKNYSDNNSDSTVFITIDYPQIENKNNDTVITKINKFLEDEFKQTITWYDEIVADTTYSPEYARENPYTFDTGYQVVYNSKEFISLIFSHYQYTGGAHGNYFAACYNINMSDGSVLTLNDIINEGSLDLLAYECEESVLETYQANSLMDAGLFENEISLTSDQDFYIIPGSLVLQFDPYEIGPYAMGEITAEIPFEKISDILKENLPFPTN